MQDPQVPVNKRTSPATLFDMGYQAMSVVCNEFSEIFKRPKRTIKDFCRREISGDHKVYPDSAKGELFLSKEGYDLLREYCEKMQDDPRHAPRKQPGPKKAPAGSAEWTKDEELNVFDEIDVIYDEELDDIEEESLSPIMTLEEVSAFTNQREPVEVDYIYQIISKLPEQLGMPNAKIIEITMRDGLNVTFHSRVLNKEDK